MALYSRISKLLIATGGHARRLANLFMKLNEFKEAFSDVKHFVQALEEYLDNNELDLLSSCDKDAEFPTSFNALFVSSHPSEKAVLMESLARDTARKFRFPNDDGTFKVHETFLKGTSLGHCQSVSDGLPLSVSSKGFAFIPQPVLAHTIDFLDGGKVCPCTEALALLAKSIGNYSNVALDKTQAGKALEAVALYSLLLAVRSNDRFNLGCICAPGSKMCGKGFDKEVLGGGDSVDLWTDISVFPRNNSDDKSELRLKVEKLVERLMKSEKNVAFFQPSDDCHMAYGLCRTTAEDEFILVIIQAFADNANSATLQAQFTQTLSEFPDSEFPYGSMELQIGQRTVSVQRRFVLFCANKPQNAFPVRPDASVASIQDMQFWLPTAYYSCQMANKLREVFHPSPSPYTLD